MREFNANDYDFVCNDGDTWFRGNYKTFVTSDIEDMVKMCRENTQFNKEMQEELLELAQTITDNMIRNHTDTKFDDLQQWEDYMYYIDRFLLRYQFYACVTKSIDVIFNKVVDKMIYKGKFTSSDDDLDISDEDIQVLDTDNILYWGLNDDLCDDDLCDEFSKIVNQDNIGVFCQTLLRSGFPEEFPKVEV